VFGKARCAIEAAAAGTAVIGCDARGMSGMLTAAGLEQMRLLNFGARTLQLPVTRENLLREIDRYDPADARAVTGRIRASNSADLLAEQFISLYEEILADPMAVSPEDDLAGLSAALGKTAHHLYGPMESSRDRYELLVKLLNSRVLDGPLRLAYRWKKRLQSR
jgi:hypothetical protein